jgi:hypothetical protein
VRLTTGVEIGFAPGDTEGLQHASHAENKMGGRCSKRRV